jgi:hypothetical protein
VGLDVALKVGLYVGNLVGKDLKVGSDVGSKVGFSVGKGKVGANVDGRNVGYFVGLPLGFDDDGLNEGIYVG